MKNRILKKLRSTRGESLGETLAAMLIIALAMTMLAGSIVSASRVNKKVKDYDTSFQNVSPAPTSADGAVTVTYTSGSDSVNVTVYTTSPTTKTGSSSSASDVHYYYYEKNS